MNQYHQGPYTTESLRYMYAQTVPKTRATAGFNEYMSILQRNLKGIAGAAGYTGDELEIYQPDRMGNPEGCYRISNGERHQDFEATEFYARGEEFVLGQLTSFIESLLPRKPAPGSGVHWKNQTPILKRGRQLNWATPK